MARYRPDAFSSCRPWQDCALMRSRAAGRGKIAPRCVQEGASDGKSAGSWQHIACMYSDSANFGKICVLCIRKAPQSAVGEYTARASCRQGAFSPSEALRSCTAHESCHPLTDLALRRGSCPSNCIAGSPFNCLAPARGAYPQRLADTRHLPMPATCRARCSQRQAADELRRRSSGAWPAVLLSPEGPPTTSSRGQADNGMLRRTGPGFQNRGQVGAEPQAEAAGPAGPASALPKRPSEGRVPLGGTIGTPHRGCFAFLLYASRKARYPRYASKISALEVTSHGACIESTATPESMTSMPYFAGM